MEENAPDTLTSVLQSRRQELGIRLFAAGLMTVCAVPGLGVEFSAGWALVYGLLQFAERRLFWARSPIFSDLSSPGSTFTFLCILAANGVLFGAIGIIEFYQLGAWGVGYASLVLAGGMLHTVITTTSAPRAFRVSIAPYILYVAVMPVMTLCAHAPLSVVGMVGFGCALLGITALKLWRRATSIQDQQRRATQALAEALQQAQAANRAKSAFLATMSHEIRTPLNGVLGMAQAMANEPLSPAQTERVDVIRQSGAALLTILNDILDLSKIEADQLDLETVAFDLPTLVRSAHSIFLDLAKAKGLEFTLDIAPQAQGVFYGDPTRLRQVLCNLLSNAVKFTNQGAVALQAGLDENFLSLTVTDTGIGIAADQIQNLFKPFSQGDTSITRRFGGTGLGLAVSRELVQKMGGELKVESTPGKGSRFSISLALLQRDERADKDVADAMNVKRTSEEVDPVLRRRPRVLAAEDNLINQRVLQTLLAEVDIDPVFVGDGRLAVQAWREQTWDLILMDVHMPEMDGVSATRDIRGEERAKARARTPIIMVTADVMSDRAADYLQAGADAVVGKPIHAPTLFEAMVAALEPDAGSSSGAAAA